MIRRHAVAVALVAAFVALPLGACATPERDVQDLQRWLDQQHYGAGGRAQVADVTMFGTANAVAGEIRLEKPLDQSTLRTIATDLAGHDSHYPWSVSLTSSLDSVRITNREKQMRAPLACADVLFGMKDVTHRNLAAGVSEYSAGVTGTDAGPAVAQAKQLLQGCSGAREVEVSAPRMELAVKDDPGDKRRLDAADKVRDLGSVTVRPGGLEVNASGEQALRESVRTLRAASLPDGTALSVVSGAVHLRRLPEEAELNAVWRVARTRGVTSVGVADDQTDVDVRADALDDVAAAAADLPGLTELRTDRERQGCVLRGRGSELPSLVPAAAWCVEPSLPQVTITSDGFAFVGAAAQSDEDVARAVRRHPWAGARRLRILRGSVEVSFTSTATGRASDVQVADRRLQPSSQNQRETRDSVVAAWDATATG